jgi:hypothetical protein
MFGEDASVSVSARPAENDHYVERGGSAAPFLKADDAEAGGEPLTLILEAGSRPLILGRQGVWDLARAAVAAAQGQSS